MKRENFDTFTLATVIEKLVNVFQKVKFEQHLDSRTAPLINLICLTLQVTSFSIHSKIVAQFVKRKNLETFTLATLSLVKAKDPNLKVISSD